MKEGSEYSIALFCFVFYKTMNEWSIKNVNIKLIFKPK